MTTEDFDGCRRECRIKNKHTRQWGECEFGIEPEPTVSIWKTYIDPSDGMKSIDTDDYTLQELAELIEPALHDFTLNFGPNSQALIMSGQSVRLSGGEAAELARLAAHAVIHRSNEGTSTVRDSGERFGISGCTCQPWTRQGGPGRILKPGEDVSLVSGWRRSLDCPHHTRAGKDPACGKALSVDGTPYPPCARPPGHREAYCRDLSGDYYFITDTKLLNSINDED